MPTSITHSMADGIDRNDRGVASSLLDLLAGLRPAWQKDAACHEFPQLSWFPEQGVDLGPVLAVCSGCLVREDCRRGRSTSRTSSRACGVGSATANG